jgi:hypothetical protein
MTEAGYEICKAGELGCWFVCVQRGYTAPKEGVEREGLVCAVVSSTRERVSSLSKGGGQRRLQLLQKKRSKPTAATSSSFVRLFVCLLLLTEVAVYVKVFFVMMA